MSVQSRNFVPAALAQFEAQGQIQGEAQGQIQGESQGQDQGQGQGQDQGQGQGQDQGQGQEQFSSNNAENSASNEVESYSGNANLNGNGNLNGNANLNLSSNDVDNDVDNAVNNAVNTNVNTNVNVSVSGEFDPPSETSVLHLDGLNVGDLDGSFIIIPDLSAQTLNGDGNIFNLDQVNSLVDADTLNGASVSLSVGVGGSGGLDFLSYEPGGPSFSFTQNATATGGEANNTTDIGDHGTASGTANGSTALTQEAFTQHIVLGANIQYNSMPISVVGGDSISDAAPSADA